MKKGDIKLYALVMAEIIAKKKTDQEGKKVIGNFLKLLEKNGELKNAKKIVESAEKYYLEKKGNKKVILETARPLNVKDFLRSFKKEGDIVEEKINTDLIAGIKITVNNKKQLDFSLQKRLQEIFSPR